MPELSLDRRSFLASVPAVGIAAVGAEGAAARERAPQTARGREALDRRIDAAIHQYRDAPSPRPPHRPSAYPDARDRFTKGLRHDPDGHVLGGCLAAFEEWRRGAAPTDRSVLGERAANNPLTGLSYGLSGADTQALSCAPPPAFASAAFAAETVELYWQAIMRDVPLDLLAGTAAGREAANELGDLGTGPGRSSGDSGLFRAYVPRDAEGPFLSQFLLLDVPYGLKTVDQRYALPSPGSDFLGAVPELVACQDGALPAERASLRRRERYLTTGRDLAEYVHKDFTYQPFLNAALILFARPDVEFDEGAYAQERTGCSSDIMVGKKALLSVLGDVSSAAQKAAFYDKWHLYERLRPEVAGLRLETERTGRRAYDLDTSLASSRAVARTLGQGGSVLLTQTYPEGSPTHPAYPAAHAVNAGACATLMKAFFVTDQLFGPLVAPSEDGESLVRARDDFATIGSEIDKLASNIAGGRSFAGVHFRSDNTAGLALGEAVALRYLQDYARTLPLSGSSFTLTGFDGRVRTVTADDVATT